MIIVRITEYTDTLCPGPPVHDCTDRTHPVAVHVVSVNSVSDIVITPGPYTTKITVRIVNNQAHGT